MAAHQDGREEHDDLIITLFLAAMSRPEAEREAFLREACSGMTRSSTEVQRRLNWERG